MDINIIKSTKDEIRAEIGSLTIAEVLRVYLNKDPAVTFAAWKRKHPSEKPILKIKTKGKTAKKAINDAVNSVTKELDNMLNDFKKLK